ncbi:hypothetical protein BGW36DRAFT_383936 [Talaromyces proteolyticus]|uniref:Uncharacterized protein n=1 Tax=Talaromyces proteolyticus TaxID=1131652 RepID=A0AAD4KJS6_9EURO|nr:uncharacterized protein BGW36DRAFT_383936 [Talaromyces proteolyticus]KAH8693901.1 hypothetical protein BGW36DRAFT_383936 [Talaromyces proteolyticus]
MPRSQYADYASGPNTQSMNFHPSQSVPQDRAWARAGSSHAGSFGHGQPTTTTTYSSSGSVSEKGSKTGQHQPRSEIFSASRSTSTSSSFAGPSNQFYDNSNYTTSQLTHPRPHRDSPEVQFLYARSRPHDEGNPPLSENHLSSSSSFSPSSLSESRARVASQHKGKKKSEPESTRDRPGDKYLKMFLEPEQVNYEDAMLEILDGMPLPHPFNASST